jgi:hypothetical protein
VNEQNLNNSGYINNGVVTIHRGVIELHDKYDAFPISAIARIWIAKMTNIEKTKNSSKRARIGVAFIIIAIALCLICGVIISQSHNYYSQIALYGLVFFVIIFFIGIAILASAKEKYFVPLWGLNVGLLNNKIYCFTSESKNLVDSGYKVFIDVVNSLEENREPVSFNFVDGSTNYNVSDNEFSGSTAIGDNAKVENNANSEGKADE